MFTGEHDEKEEMKFMWNSPWITSSGNHIDSFSDGNPKNRNNGISTKPNLTPLVPFPTLCWMTAICSHGYSQVAWNKRRTLSQTCTQARRMKEENTAVRNTTGFSCKDGTSQWGIIVPGTHWIKLATMALKCARISLRISTSLSFSASRSMRVRSTYSKNKAPRAKVSRSKAPFVLGKKKRKIRLSFQMISLYVRVVHASWKIRFTARGRTLNLLLTHRQCK